MLFTHPPVIRIYFQRNYNGAPWSPDRKDIYKVPGNNSFGHKQKVIFCSRQIY